MIDLNEILKMRNKLRSVKDTPPPKAQAPPSAESAYNSLLRSTLDQIRNVTAKSDSEDDDEDEENADKNSANFSDFDA